MQFITPLPGYSNGRVPITTPTIRVAKKSLGINIPEGTVASMGWVPGDKIEIGYDPARRVFGLRRATQGFALIRQTGKSKCFRIAIGVKNLPRMSFFGTGGGTATSVHAEKGLLLLGDPTTPARLSAAV